jgi:chromobox protein 1
MSRASPGFGWAVANKDRDGAVDVLNEYFEEIGGRPEAKSAQKRKSRPSGVKSQPATPATSAKRVKQEKAWSPPPGSWEHDVDYIDTVEERQDPKTGELAKFAYLVWNNDKKTQHPLKHVYQKCPQKVRRV